MGTEANIGRASETNLGMGSETHTGMEPRDGGMKCSHRDGAVWEWQRGVRELERHLDKGRNSIKRDRRLVTGRGPKRPQPVSDGDAMTQGGRGTGDPQGQSVWGPQGVVDTGGTGSWALWPAPPPPPGMLLHF